LISSIKEDKKYETIRVAEPDLFPYKKLPLVQFVKPTIISRIRFNKSIPEERLSDPNFTLTDFYFTDNREETDHKLNML